MNKEIRFNNSIVLPSQFEKIHYIESVFITQIKYDYFETSDIWNYTMLEKQTTEVGKVQAYFRVKRKNK